MIGQLAIVDAWIALWSLATWWLWAPALISAKTAIKWWLKTMWKWLFKTIEKWAVKDWAKLLEEWLTKKLWEWFVKALKWEDDIAKVILKDWAWNSANYLTKAKIAIEEVWKDVLKENPKAYEKFVKQNKSVFESLWVWTTKLTTKETLILDNSLGLNFESYYLFKDYFPITFEEYKKAILNKIEEWNKEDNVWLSK